MLSNALIDTSNTISVPSDYHDLQDAINNVGDGDIIEIAGGTYTTPKDGFEILELNKNFTIRAAAGSTVVLSGGGGNRIFNIQNLPTSPQNSVVFIGITFSNGFTDRDGAGSITIYKMNVTFIDCVFQNNRKFSSPTHTAGGAISGAMSSRISIFNSRFENNMSQDGGGGIGIRDSELYVHNTQFLGNATEDVSSSSVPPGAAINAGNSILRVTNSYFKDQTSAGHGAAIWATGEWHKSEMDAIITNSTFLNNRIERNYATSNPIEGGAVTVENFSRMQLHNSRFVTNNASIGGAISIFRAKAEIYQCVFQGNRATGTIPTSGFGGAISFNPYDRPDHASLSVEDSLFQGRYGSVGSVAQFGGGIQSLGSIVPQKPNVSIRRTVFSDLDVTTPPDSTRKGTGGALGIGEVNFLLEDSIIINSDASGPNGGFGGGIALYPNSNANINRSIIAFNHADTFGGGLFAQAAQFTVTESTFLRNQLSGDNQIYGAAIFTAPEDARNIPINGSVTNSVFANNSGIAIFDDDRLDGPINSVIYDNNLFFENTFGQDVYKNAITPFKTPQELNSLIVTHTGGLPSVDKSIIDNSALSSTPTVSTLLATPSTLLPVAAPGDPDQTPPAFLAYVWNGSSATLDGTPLANQVGVMETSTPGTHTLNANGITDSVHVTNAQAPNFSLNVDPGAPAVLDWSLLSGQYLDMAIDNGVSYTPAPDGTANLTSSIDDYSFFGVTEEGGYFSVVSEDPLYTVFLPITIR